MCIALVAVLAAAVVPSVAHAAFPGQNGLVVFTQTVPDGGSVAIYAMNADGTGKTPLTADGAFHEDYNPVVSPDGTKIAFVRNLTAQADVWVMNADGTGEVRLTTLENVGSVAWSPDGTEIVFDNGHTVGSTFNYDIYKISAAGGTPTQLTSTTTWETNPSWAPDGSKIAFELGSEIHTMDPDGTDVLNIGIDGVEVDWSPDSLQFAFTLAGQIRVANVNGTGNTVVHPGPNAEAPAWSPDGTKILFMRQSANGNSTDIWQVSSTGANPINVTATPGSIRERYPNWGPCPAAGCEPLPTDAIQPVSTIARPRNGLSYYQANLTQFTGTATDTGGSGVAKVQIAFRRYFTDGTCANWNGSVFVAGACNLRVWKDAVGTGSWTYDLPRVLTRSTGSSNVKHYILMSRAIDVAGNTESLITDGRNRNQFEVI
jgi:Tol biopolymer transport system component